MFLKRIGAVSRQVKDKEIPMEKKLTGVDFFSEITCPVWNTIYDFVYQSNEFFQKENRKRCELAMVMQLEHCVDKAESIRMWSWLSSHVSYIMTDWNMVAVRKLARFKMDREITINDKSYWFITL